MRVFGKRRLNKLNSAQIFERAADAGNLRQPLLATQIAFGRLYAYMPKQKLDLLKSPAGLVAEPSTSSS